MKLSKVKQKDKHELIQQAKDIHKDILPVGSKKCFDDCFTLCDFNNEVKLIFWFDTTDGSTHIVKKVLAFTVT